LVIPKALVVAKQIFIKNYRDRARLAFTAGNCAPRRLCGATIRYRENSSCSRHPKFAQLSEIPEAIKTFINNPGCHSISGQLNLANALDQLMKRYDVRSCWPKAATETVADAGQGRRGAAGLEARRAQLPVERQDPGEEY